MFLSFEYSKRVFLFYNGYTESPFSHVPKSNVDQSMSPNELQHHYSKKKGHNRWPEEAHFSGVHGHTWKWTSCSCESLTPIRVGILWHTTTVLGEEKLVRLWWQPGISLSDTCQTFLRVHELSIHFIFPWLFLNHRPTCNHSFRKQSKILSTLLQTFSFLVIILFKLQNISTVHLK